MRPIVLVHGYSAESRTTDFEAVHKIYGDLPDDLRSTDPVVEIDLSRWISLNDAVTIRDIAYALDRVLRAEHPRLLSDPGFDAIIHSTGALVLRAWVRYFSPKPSPLRNLIHLAGANLGSGLALLGQGQIARWYRFLGEGGAQPGVKVLQALEFGSSATLDMHLELTRDGTHMVRDYQVQEYSIVGSQPHPKWFEYPIRYVKEDGSDGTVRVSSSNLNFNYVRIEPAEGTESLAWAAVQGQAAAAAQRAPVKENYRVAETSLSGKDRAPIPFAIPFHCAHGGDETGIVSGAAPRAQVRRLIRQALATDGRSPGAWQGQVPLFAQETASTYRQAAQLPAGSPLSNYLTSPSNQYDPHAQISFRFRDQGGDPIPASAVDIFIGSDQTGEGVIPLQKLIEDTVISGVSPNVITFFLRVSQFDPATRQWIPQLDKVRNPFLEITALDAAASPQDPVVAYLPLRLSLAGKLTEWVREHQDTIVDVRLLRVPSPEVYRLTPYPGR